MYINNINDINNIILFYFILFYFFLLYFISLFQFYLNKKKKKKKKKIVMLNVIDLPVLLRMELLKFGMLKLEES